MHQRIVVLTLLASLGASNLAFIMLQVFQKQLAEIKCNFETTDTAPFLFWYIQPLNGFPRHLLTRTPTYKINAEGFEERFKSTLNLEDKTNRFSNLRKHAFCISEIIIMVASTDESNSFFIKGS
uniref:Uncharacterized protein n=1 Tax=Erpetoichthys calabaricus TaxID=27687 RepID=A0A8C4RY52_ERPCA